MTTWYVRPDTSHSGTRDGTSYATAWGGWSEIVWGGAGIVAGDTLYVCGTHAYSASIAVGAHGATSDANRVTIRGDYSASPGAFLFSSTAFFDATRSWTTIFQIAFNSTAAGYNCIYVSAPSGLTVDHCTFVGGDAAIAFNSTVAFQSGTVSNCTMTGQVTAGINQWVNAASITSQNISIIGNVIHDTGIYGMQLAMSSVAWNTSKLVNYLILNNTIYNTPGPSIYLRTCNNDQSTAPSVYSDGLVVHGNNISNCGTVAGANGNHGGLLVMGFVSPIISGNSVLNCYVTGAGIQTAKNTSPQIICNTVSGILSGTPTSQFQNGQPIDGNGIFIDILTIGSALAIGNRVNNMPGTALDASGAGLAFWRCSGGRFFGNVVDNCKVGVFFGHAAETGNQASHNTFTNCQTGVLKVGTDALAGNMTVVNNNFIGSQTGFSIGANPSISVDYNNVNAIVPYSGISAGARDPSSSLSILGPLPVNYR